MDVEQLLIYSSWVSGTADAVRFEPLDNTLYIFDLKTGERPASIDQVVIYAALWCLQRNIDPYSISFDLRIYSNTKFIMYTTKESGNELSDKISDYMNQIIFVTDTANNYKINKED